jgi:hypothetical protein
MRLPIWNGEDQGPVSRMQGSVSDPRTGRSHTF